MATASLNASSVTPDLLTLSDPARSIKYSVPFVWFPVALSFRDISVDETCVRPRRRRVQFRVGLPHGWRPPSVISASDSL